jgi:hypothetical protein
MESDEWDLRIYSFHRTVLLVLTWQREEELCSADLSLCWDEQRSSRRKLSPRDHLLSPCLVWCHIPPYIMKTSFSWGWELSCWPISS